MGYRYENGIQKIEWPDAPETTPYTLTPAGAKQTPDIKADTYPLYERRDGTSTGFSVHFDLNANEVTLVNNQGTTIDSRNYGSTKLIIERLRELATEDIQQNEAGKPRFGPDYTIVPTELFLPDTTFKVNMHAKTIYQDGSKPGMFKKIKTAFLDWKGHDTPDGIVRAYKLHPQKRSKAKKRFGVVVRYGPLRAYGTIVDMKTGTPIAGQPTVVAHEDRKYSKVTKSNMADGLTRRAIVAGIDGIPMWSPKLPTTRARRAVQIGK